MIFLSRNEDVNKERKNSMSKENINLGKTSDDKRRKVCDAYDNKTLMCEIKDKPCDMCYSDTRSMFN